MACPVRHQVNDAHTGICIDEHGLDCLPSLEWYRSLPYISGYKNVTVYYISFFHFFQEVWRENFKKAIVFFGIQAFLRPFLLLF